MLYPLRRNRIGSPFGWRRIAGRDDYHSGLDFAAPMGEPVTAAAAGIVRAVYAPGQWQRGGRTIVLEHPATPAPLFTLYAHLSAAHVEPGQVVGAGDLIGAVGDTAGTRENPDARTQRPHLHFELLTRWPPSGIDRDRIDPAPYLTGSPSGPSLRTRAAGIGAAVAVLALLWAWQKKEAPATSVAGARSSQRYLFGTTHARSRVTL